MLLQDHQETGASAPVLLVSKETLMSSASLNAQWTVIVQTHLHVSARNARTHACMTTNAESMQFVKSTTTDLTAFVHLDMKEMHTKFAPQLENVSESLGVVELPASANENAGLFQLSTIGIEKNSSTTPSHSHIYICVIQNCTFYSTKARMCVRSRMSTAPSMYRTEM